MRLRLLLVAPILAAAACESTPPGLTPEECSSVDQVNSEAPGLTLANRPVSLKAEVVAEGVIQPTPDVTWTSSNPAVFDIGEGNVGEPVAAGEAIVVATACDVTDSVNVTVLASGYDVTFIGGYGNDLNELGQVVGYAQTGPSTYSYWLRDGAASTTIDPCRGFAISEQSDVLCSGPGPTIWRDGSTVQLDTITSRLPNAMSDSGYFAMTGPTVSPMLWKAPGDTTEIPVGLAWIEGMNRRGDVLGHNDPPGRTTQLWRDGVLRDLAAPGRHAIGVALNDSGDVVGSVEFMNPIQHRNVAAVWRKSVGWAFEPLRKAKGMLPNAVVLAATDINNHGDILGSSDAARGPLVVRDGRIGFLTTLLNDPTWQITSVRRINDAGVILATGVHAAVGSGAVLLTPAQ